VSFTNNQVNFPVANASASINNTGALINVNTIRYHIHDLTDKKVSLSFNMFVFFIFNAVKPNWHLA
jgi:hypothetical protein